MDLDGLVGFGGGIPREPRKVSRGVTPCWAGECVSGEETGWTSTIASPFFSS
jgi:hypothetical protein